MGMHEAQVERLPMTRYRLSAIGYRHWVFAWSTLPYP